MQMTEVEQKKCVPCIVHISDGALASVKPLILLFCSLRIDLSHKRTRCVCCEAADRRRSDRDYMLEREVLRIVQSHARGADVIRKVEAVDALEHVCQRLPDWTF